VKRGQLVMVYEDPITKLRCEGQAVLVRPVEEGRPLERWMVRFVGTGLPEQPVLRAVWPQDVQNESPVQAIPACNCKPSGNLAADEERFEPR